MKAFYLKYCENFHGVDPLVELTMKSAGRTCVKQLHVGTARSRR